MIIDCVADLHGFFPQLDGGDLLIVGGDHCARHESPSEQLLFFSWMQSQKYKKIIFIAGNHDTWLEEVSHDCSHLDRLVYLCDSGTEFQGLRIWGSPWTKTFRGINPKCKAFTLKNEKALFKKWKKIPENIDILVTHSPPYGLLDRVQRRKIDPTTKAVSISAECCGSITLAQEVDRRTNLKLHVFGHIHEGYGAGNLRQRVYVNASIQNEVYEPINKPIRIVL